MTYNVFGGTLNPAQSNPIQAMRMATCGCIVELWKQKIGYYMRAIRMILLSEQHC